MKYQIYVFCIPLVDKERLCKVRAALCDVFTVREIIQSPQTMEKLFAYTEMRMQKKEFWLSPWFVKAWKSFY